MSTDADAPNLHHHVSEYFRLERWEIPPPPGSEAPSAFGGRAPVDTHQRNPAGGLRTGGLLTSIDSLGGFLCGVAVLPQWIVTTSLMATVARVDHVGPLRLHGEVVRRGRSAVVARLDVVDEGADEAGVASALMTCAVLDPGAMDLEFARPFVLPMGPLQEEAPAPEEFFGIDAGSGLVTRLALADHLRNPWGILHGGAVAMLADVAACRAVAATVGSSSVAAGSTVLHYLRPSKVGPIEARCRVLDGGDGRHVVRVEMHDVGVDDRLVTLASVDVLEV